MITLYHLGASQSDRIVWLLEELNLPYQLEWYDRGEDGLSPPEYRALHPVGTAPIIKDGELLLCESTAIVEYLSQRYGNGSLSVAVDSPDYPHYLYWLQFNNNVQAAFMVKLANPDADPASNRILTTVQRREQAHYQFLEQRLSEVPYLAGSRFTCADIMTVFNLTSLPLFGGRGIDDLPNTQAYVERIIQRPAYIKAMAIAGPGAKNPAHN